MDHLCINTSVLQAGLSREVECLKDQVDVLREHAHKSERYEHELTDIRQRLQDFQVESSDMAEIIRQSQNRTLMSLESETCLSSSSVEQLEVIEAAGGGMDQSTQSLLSQKNNLLEETIVTPVTVEHHHHRQKDEVVSSAESSAMVVTSSTKTTTTTTTAAEVVVQKEESVVQQRAAAGPAVVTPDINEDSTLASRPESELILVGIEEDVGAAADEEEQPTHRQLERLLEGGGGLEEDEDRAVVQAVRRRETAPDATSQEVEALLRDIRDPGLDCSLEDLEAVMEGKEVPKKDLKRVSPEFTQAANLIEKEVRGRAGRFWFFVVYRCLVFWVF